MRGQEVKSKYHAQPTYVGEHRFASKKEAARYEQLLFLARGNVIKNLELQPKFPLIVGGAKVCTYIGDFAYFEADKRVIEDVKGFKTPAYRIKRKLLLALNPGLDHREISA